MTKYVHPDVLDNGLNYIKTHCDKIAVISSYSAGDSYATVNAAILAEAAMAPDDFTLANGASGSRTITSAAGKQDASANAGNTAGTGANNQFAFFDTLNSKVLWVTDETSNQDVVLGNPIDFPSLVYTSWQPV